MAKVLVTGANGAQGGAVINELIASGFRVRAFSSSGKHAAQFQLRGIEVALGSYEDVTSLSKALTGIDYVFLSFPVQFDEIKALQYTRAFIAAVKGSNIKLVVYNSSAWYPDSPGSILLHTIRLRMEMLLKEARIPLIILRPTLYLNNFLGPWSLPLILEKGLLTYPVQANQKIAWTSHEALAAFTAKAFENEHLAGKRFDIGNYLLTGEEIAQKFSILLNKGIQFNPIEPSQFEEKLALQAGSSLARAVADSYRYIFLHPEPFQRVTSPEIFEQLGITIETADAWLLRNRLRFKLSES